MPTNQNITREQARAITAELTAAITDVFAHHGLTAPTLKTTFGLEYKVTASGSPIVLNDRGANTATPEATAYAVYGRGYGLSDGLLGVTVSIGGKQATFAGIAAKRAKYPFAFDIDGGKRVFHQNAPTIVAALNAAVTA